MKGTSISDYEVGQEVWIERTGDAARGHHGEEHYLLFSGTVEKVGRKYVTVGSITFEEPHSDRLEGLVQKTPYSSDYTLYPSYEAAVEHLRKEEAIALLRKRLDEVSLFGRNSGIPLKDVLKACDLFQVKLPERQLNGMEDVFVIVDSFQKGGTFRGLPHDFGKQCAAYIGEHYTEEQVRHFSAKTIQTICMELAKEYQREDDMERE